MTYVALALGVVFILGASPHVWMRSPKTRQRELHRFARRVNLSLTPDVEPAVLRRLVRRGWHITAGGLAGLIAVAAMLVLVDGFGEWDFAPMAIFAAVLGGVAMGGATSAVAGMLPPRDDGKRVARLITPRYADYVAGFERWGAVGAVGTGVVALGVGAATGVFSASSDTASGATLPAGTIAAFVMVGLAVLSLAASLVVSTAIVAHGQRATTELGLAWDDALRASALRDIVTVPILLGLYGFVLSVYTISEEHASDGIAIIMMVALAVGLVIAIGLAIYSLASSPQQFYRRRLWPNGAQDAGAR